MKIVIITPRVPEILDKGDKLRIFYQIKYLSISHEIHLISLSSNRKEKLNTELEKYVTSFHLIITSKKKRILNLIYYSITKKLPLQVSYYYCQNNKEKINQIITNLKPDYIYSQLIRTAEYIKDRNEKKIIDFMDCFSLGLKRRSKRSNILIKSIVLFEYKRVKKYESNIFDFFQKHSIISEFDQKHINHKQNKKIRIIKNGIDTTYFKRKKNKYEKNTIIFVGNMSYKPNVIAAKFICKKILPLVEKEIKNTKVIIAGSNPSQEVKSLSKISKNIIITGFMEDIREAYEKGTVFIAPMFIGSGLQNKLLEAMSMKIPCITTEIANRSLNATKNEIIIASDEHQFAKSCIKLFNKKEEFLNIIENGHKFVKSKFNWEESTNKINKILKS